MTIFVNVRLELSSNQRADMISALVLALTNVPLTGSKEAGQLMWTLKRDILVECEELTPHVVTVMYACQRAASDVRSSIANRTSYAVAVGALQLIRKYVIIIIIYIIRMSYAYHT